MFFIINRCICPHGSVGTRCKIIKRYFKTSPKVKQKTVHLKSEAKVLTDPTGWVWLPPIPSCQKVHISLEILTTEENALLLYSGPDDKTPPKGGSLYSGINYSLKFLLSNFNYKTLAK